MKKKTHVSNSSNPLGKVFLVALLGCLPGPLLHAQEIRIRVLDGRNGKPITNECVNVFVPGEVNALVVPVDKKGMAVLRLEGGAPGPISPGSTKACNGLATPHPTVGSDDEIRISGDYYVACQEYVKTRPDQPVHDPVQELMPAYPIRKILESGMTSGNTCGKFRAKPKPGELIFFVRPRSFWERLKQ